MKVQLAVVVGVLLFAGTAHADSTWVYTYTGNELNGCQCSINGSFSTAGPISSSQLEPISVLSYSFSVAGFTFNSSDSTGGISVATDANGDILDWFVSLDAGNYVNLITEFTGSQENAIDVYGYGSGPYDEDYREADPGSWTATDPAAMPEPSSLLLAALGLAGLIALSRRRLANG